MSRLRLVRVAIVGDSVPAASIEIGPRLTVIFGASDTGKSYIVDVIDYMLGGKELRRIPEDSGYSSGILVLETGDGSRITLVRPLSGGRLSAYLGDHRSVPKPAPDFHLAWKHGQGSAKSPSLSEYLLAELDLQDRRVRKKANGQVQSFTFRNLVLLTVVGETKMQAVEPPPHAGQWTSRTADESALRMILQGEDDSASATTLDEAKRKVSKGQAEILDRVIADLTRSLGDQTESQGLIERLARIDEAIVADTEAVNGLLARRNELVSRQMAVSSALTKTSDRFEEVSHLRARFGLLGLTYESDMSRLESVAEAGDLLGYFQPGVCVFCGAAVEDQDSKNHTADEVTSFGASVLAEVEKTRLLRDDLTLAIADLESEADSIRQEVDTLIEDQLAIVGDIKMLDRDLSPQRLAIRELMSTRSEVERCLGIIAQLEQIRELRSTVAPVPPEGQQARTPTSSRVYGEFADTIRDVLARWRLPLTSVDFAADANDVIVDGQPRTSRGKGMRAILHAAFTVALAEFCLSRQMPHPSFVVLDSPLITYKEPDGEVQAAEAEAHQGQGSVGRAFFLDLSTPGPVQVVVLENTDPPSELPADTVLVRFSKRTGVGRYGFIPESSAGTQVPAS